jgi:hypothetical protein
LFTIIIVVNIVTPKNSDYFTDLTEITYGKLEKKIPERPWRRACSISYSMMLFSCFAKLEKLGRVRGFGRQQESMISNLKQ